MSVRFNQPGYNVRDFGAVGDGVTDDAPAFQAAINASINTGLARGRRIFVPRGNYRLASTVYLRRQVHLTGETGGGWFSSAVLLPDANVTALQVDLESLIAFPGNRGSWSVIEDLRIAYTAGLTSVWQPSTLYQVGDLVVSTLGANRSDYYTMECTTAGTSASSEPNWDAVVGPIYDGSPRTLAEGATVTDGTVTWTLRVLAGVRVHTGAKVRNVDIENAPGNGILVAASVDWNPYANANVFSVLDCFVQGSAMNGLYVVGPDANAGNVSNFNAVSNARWGIWDRSFLGNTYVACHAATNGQHRAVDVISRTANVVTVEMSIAHGLTTGDLVYLYLSAHPGSFPVGIKTVASTPSATEFTYVEVGSNALEPGTGYDVVVAGGAYKASDVNARNVFLGCYSEQDELPSEIDSPAIVLGGLHASGFKAGASPSNGLRVVDGVFNSLGTKFFNPAVELNPKKTLAELANNVYAVQFTSASEGSPPAITSLTRSSGLVTAVTASPHGYQAGQRRWITGISDANFAAGLKTIYEVIDATTFTYLEAGADATGNSSHHALGDNVGTGFTLGDNGPANFEGWWLWRHGNSDVRKLMAWSGNLAPQGPGRLWLPQGFYLSADGQDKTWLDTGNAAPSGGTWLFPTFLRGALRINTSIHDQTGFNTGIFGYQLLNSNTGRIQTLRWSHVGPGNQIDITNGVGSPYALDWAVHAGCVFTNQGATAKVYATLPQNDFSSDGRFAEFSFSVVDADGMRITAPAGRRIRWGQTVGTNAGYIESTTVGAWLKLKLVGPYTDPEWMVTEAQGIWTDGTTTFYGLDSVSSSGGSGGVTDQATSVTLDADDDGETFTNYGAAGAVTFTAPASPDPGYTVRLRVSVAETVTLDLNAAHTLYVDDAISTSAGGTIHSNTVGSGLTVQYVGNDTWFVDSIQGTWATT